MSHFKSFEYPQFIIIIIFLYKIEFYFSIIYVYTYVKLSPEDLNLNPYSPALLKHLYLKNDHHAKGTRW